MLAAGDPTDPVQIIDARDLSEWVVRLVEQGTTGTFNDVLASQYPTNDPSSPYYGAVPANYAQGVGLTCDNLSGFTDAGYKVNGEGVKAPAGLEASWPAPYEYYAKAA